MISTHLQAWCSPCAQISTHTARNTQICARHWPTTRNTWARCQSRSSGGPLRVRLNWVAGPLRQGSSTCSSAKLGMSRERYRCFRTRCTKRGGDDAATGSPCAGIRIPAACAARLLALPKRCSTPPCRLSSKQSPVECSCV